MVIRAWRSWSWSWGCAALAALAFVGCGDTERSDDEPDVAGKAGAKATGGAGGSVAVAGSPGAGEGGAGAPRQGPTEIDRLKACDAEEHCGRSFAQLVEGSEQYIDTEGTVCVLEALRARRPGRYVHVADATDTGSSTSSTHVLVVNGSGEVVHAMGRHASSYDGSSSDSVRGERCRLKPPSYFAACAAAVAGADAELGFGGASDEAWECAFGSEGRTPGPMLWFERCELETELTCDEPSCGTAETSCCKGEPLPCQGLSEAECSARSQCESIKGKPFDAGALDGEGGSAAAPFDGYLGCRSLCRGLGGDAISCSFDPAAPDDCFMTGTTAGPDGWTEVFECGFESGQCGTP